MRTRTVTEGAMTAAGILVLCILNYIFGLFNLFIPALLGIFVYRNGPKAGIVVAMAAAVLSSLMLFTPLIALELMIVGLLGVTIGVGLREKFNFGMLILIGVGASVLATLLRFSSLSVISGVNFFETYLEIWQNTSQQSLSIWEGLGLSEEVLAEYEEVLAALPTLLQMMIPLIFVGLGLIETWITLVIMRLVLVRTGEAEVVPKIPRFSHWRFPHIFTYGFIIGKILVVITLYNPSEMLQVVALNIDTFFSYAFLIQGIAIGWYLLAQAGIHKIFRFLLLFFIFTSGGLLRTALMFFGFLDSWFDFRKFNKQKEELE